MTKRRAVFVTRTERVISYARHGNRVATISETGLHPTRVQWRISIHSPNHVTTSQHLRCSCGWSRSQPYPLVNGLIESCPHVEALLRGEVVTIKHAVEDPPAYHAELTRLGARLFAWKIAERALAESRL